MSSTNPTHSPLDRYYVELEINRRDRLDRIETLSVMATAPDEALEIAEHVAIGELCDQRDTADAIAAWEP